MKRQNPVFALEKTAMSWVEQSERSIVNRALVSFQAFALRVWSGFTLFSLPYGHCT